MPPTLPLSVLPDITPAPAFPMHVFPAAVQSFPATLTGQLPGREGWIGLAALQAASAVIGTAVRAKTATQDTNLSLWGCTVGPPMSGKTWLQYQTLLPLVRIQEAYERGDKPELGRSLLAFDLSESPSSVFAQNQSVGLTKGIAYCYDELTSFIAKLDDGSRNKAWQVVWSSTKESFMLADSDAHTLIEKNHLAISVIMTSQPDVLPDFYADDRLESGFVFKMLWAFGEVPAPMLCEMLLFEAGVSETWANLLRRLHNDLPMGVDSQPHFWLLNDRAITYHRAWRTFWCCDHTKYRDEKKRREIIRLKILNVMDVYVLRFAAILKAMHIAASGENLNTVTLIEEQYIAWAHEVANYFMATGWQAYTLATTPNATNATSL